jgi:hypothetical protein
VCHNTEHNFDLAHLIISNWMWEESSRRLQSIPKKNVAYTNPAQPRFLHGASANRGHAVDRLSSQRDQDNLHRNHKPKHLVDINMWTKK